MSKKVVSKENPEQIFCQKLMSLADKVCYAIFYLTFYLWRIKFLLKDSKLPKYYAQD